jgi:phospholipase/lecithinase/hemolysin
MGAKRIGFVGVPPLGCCPSQITLGGSPSRQCEPLRNQASILFNSRISQEIEKLNAERSVSGSKIAYFDIYYNLFDLIQNPASYGKSFTVRSFIVHSTTRC